MYVSDDAPNYSIKTKIQKYSIDVCYYSGFFLGLFELRCVGIQSIFLIALAELLIPIQLDIFVCHTNVCSPTNQVSQDH